MKILFAFFAFITTTSGIAQINKDIELKSFQDLECIATVSNSENIVIEIREELDLFSTKKRLVKLDGNLQTKWDVELNEYLYSTYIISSNQSEHTYYVGKNQKDKKGTSTYVVYRIDPNGKKDRMQLVLPNEDLIAAYTDKLGLFYITSKTDKKTNNNSLVIHRLGHDAKKFEKVSFSIQNLIGENISDQQFVEFLGHDDNNIYLSKKMISLSKNVLKYVVYTIAKDGFTNIAEDEFFVEPKYKIIPAYNTRNKEGSIIKTKDYTVTYEQNSTTYTLHEGAFGCGKLDIKTGIFYAYGLVSDKAAATKDKDAKSSKSDAMNLGVGGYYLNKYDFNSGKLISSTENLFDKKQIEDFKGPFNTNSFFNNKDIWIDVIDSTKTIMNIANSSPKSFLLNINLQEGSQPIVNKYTKELFSDQKSGNANKDRNTKGMVNTSYNANYFTLAAFGYVPNTSLNPNKQHLSTNYYTYFYPRLFSPLFILPQSVNEFCSDANMRTKDFSKSLIINNEYVILLTNYSLNNKNSRIELEKHYFKLR